MNKRKAMAWVRALRSGKYKQGTEQLLTEYGNQKAFCCLGVLAKISKYHETTLLGVSCLCDRSSLCGLKEGEGTPYDESEERVFIKIGRREYVNLADANDSGCTFEQIAKWIEKNYELL